MYVWKAGLRQVPLWPKVPLVRETGTAALGAGGTWFEAAQGKKKPLHAASAVQRRSASVRLQVPLARTTPVSTLPGRQA